MNKTIESLHSHTLYSDGKLTHEQVLEITQKLGISVVAFTDHDALPQTDLVENLKRFDTRVRWLVGIEISSGLPIELGGGVNGPHIVGLFVDPTDKNLLSYCNNTQKERIIRMEKIVKNLRKLGFTISKEAVLKKAMGKSVGQPHIVAALKDENTNLELIDKFREKMRKEAENNDSIRQKYDLMMQQGPSQYPYALFLGDTAFVEGVKVPYQYWLDLDKSVSLIRNAGGIAVIAHYATVKSDLNFDKLEQLLSENRLDGMETVYGLWKYGTDEENDMINERLKVKELVKKYHKISTGGADAHDLQDWRRFAEEDWFSGETEGMAETIIKKHNVSLEWTNFR